MLQLASTSDLIQVITGSAASIKAHVSWVDYLSSPDSAVPGRTNTAISSIATTTIVASPSGSYKRNIRYLSVFNNDTSLSSTISIVQTDTVNPVVLWKGTLNPGEWVVANGKGDWKFYSTGGIIVKGYGTVVRDLQVFTTPLRASWVKPSGAKVVCAICIGAGGGGQWGGVSTSAGGGGGGGAYQKKYFLADDLSGTEIVQVGRGGRGGHTAIATRSGGTGNASVFGVFALGGNRSRMVAGGGGGADTGGGGGGGGTGGNGAPPPSGSDFGPGGDPQPQAGGAGSVCVAGSGANGINAGFSAFTGQAEYGGAGGGSSNGGGTVPVSTPGGSSIWGGGGGGGGAGYNAVSPFTPQSASDGGASSSITPGGGGAAGTSGVSPTNGSDGASGNSACAGSGGGGGGSTIGTGTAGGNGGAGGQPGGGGGGGGTSKNGTGGNGGNGGDGAVYVFTW